MRLLLDCDGILADFHEMYLDAVYKITEVKLNKEEWIDWNYLSSINLAHRELDISKYIEEHRLCSEIPVYENSVDAVNKIRNYMDVVIVTAPMNVLTWCGERLLWLRKHFDIPKSKVIFASSKHYIDGDFFLDDHLDNCKKWAEHNDGISMLWDRPWNRSNRKNMTEINVVGSWQDVFSILGI